MKCTPQLSFSANEVLSVLLPFEHVMVAMHALSEWIQIMLNLVKVWGLQKIRGKVRRDEGK